MTRLTHVSNFHHLGKRNQRTGGKWWYGYFQGVLLELRAWNEVYRRWYVRKGCPQVWATVMVVGEVEGWIKPVVKERDFRFKELQLE